MNWKQSIYSDGSKYFVSNPRPKLGDEITIQLRMLVNDRVLGVQLRLMINGEEHIEQMERLNCEGVFCFYKKTIVLLQPLLNYHFIIYSKDEILFYNQFGLTDIIPTEDYDFKLIANYQGPDWISRSVFYQIFPDRFKNGNTANDVLNDEYMFDGHGTIQCQWDEIPKEYDEAHCLDFYGGDLEGIQESIPYFKVLGVTALYINPIFHSATSHRYDCLDYFKVDPHVGGDQGLAHLTEELHQNNMKVIIDVSINHTGIAHKWFNSENTFFPKEIGAFHNKDAPERAYYFFNEDNTYHSWFNVKTLPTLNYTSQALRDLIYQSEDALVKKWMKYPYFIDGWRFDVASTMARQDHIQLSHEVWREIRKNIHEVNKAAYVVGEHWTDCNGYLQGDMWDTAMNYFGCARPVRQFVGDQDLFFARNQALASIQIPLQAHQLKTRILQHLARMPYQLMNSQYNLLDSHDIYRLHHLKGMHFERYKIAVMIMYLLPGAPSIYYGDEIKIGGTSDTIEGCRYPMVWERDKWDQETFQLYQTLSHEKQTNPCLHEGGFKFLYAEGKIICMTRFVADEVIVLVASMENETKHISIPVDLVGITEAWEGLDIFGKSLKPYEMKFVNNLLELQLPSETSLMLKFLKK